MTRKKNVFLVAAPFVIVIVFFVLAVAAEAASSSAITHCRLDIAVDPATAMVTGVMDISAEKGRELTIYRNDAKIREFRIAGRKRDVGKEKGENTPEETAEG